MKNIIILTEYDSLYNYSGCVISGDSIRYLTKEELDSLKDDKLGSYFDAEKIEEYIKLLNLNPCIIIRAIDGDIFTLYL